MDKKVLSIVALLISMVIVAGLIIYLINSAGSDKVKTVKLDKEFKLNLNQKVKVKDKEVYLKLTEFINITLPEGAKGELTGTQVNYDFTVDGQTYSYSSSFNDNEKYTVNIIKSDYTTYATFSIVEK